VRQYGKTPTNVETPTNVKLFKHLVAFLTFVIASPMTNVKLSAAVKMF